jgi:arylsulfatase A-like enzyme
VMHVPLVMIWPGRIPAGLRVPTLVSLVDVSPTILDLAGIPVPAAMEGKSLVPLLRAQPGTIPRDVVFGESPPISSIPEPRFVARSADAKCMLTASDHGDACFVPSGATRSTTTSTRRSPTP